MNHQLCATLSYTLSVSFAVFSQENCLTLSKPFLIKSFLKLSLIRTLYIASAIFSILCGSIKIPASHTTSGIEVALEATTGQPHAIASKGGSPKPSKNEGKAEMLAKEYK